MRITSPRQVVLAAALVALAAMAGAMPVYSPAGPQNSVLFGTVTGGGWSQCFSGPYGATTTVASALSGCTGDLLMMAGAPNGSATIQLLAWAPIADVTFVTATNAVHNANDVDWYFNNASWGFAPEGFGISQQSCDTNSAPGFGNVGDSGAQRLCWHTSLSGPGSLDGGWRVGNNTFLNSEPSGYTRYLFTASSVPEPASGALFALGLGAAAAYMAWRRRQE